MFDFELDATVSMLRMHVRKTLEQLVGEVVVHRKPLHPRIMTEIEGIERVLNTLRTHNEFHLQMQRATEQSNNNT